MSQKHKNTEVATKELKQSAKCESMKAQGPQN